MQLQLKLKQILPEITGESKNGPWKKQELIFEMNDRFSKMLCLITWGNKINTSDLKTGKTYVVDFDAESRDYKGRWFTELKICRISEEKQESHGDQNTEINPFNGFDDGNDILPF